MATPVAGALYALVPVSHVETCWMRSSPPSDARASCLSIVHFDTNAPLAPCARATPSAAGSSWLRAA